MNTLPLFRCLLVAGIISSLFSCKGRDPAPEEPDPAQTVFAGSQTYFYALDAKTLAVKWKNYQAYNIKATPAYSDGTVYALSADTYHGQLFALDAETGNIKWQADSIYGSAPALTVAQGVLYVGTSYGDLIALDAKSGTRKWKYSSGSSISDGATVVNGVIYFNNFKTLYALNALTGQKIWQVDGLSTSNPSVVDGVVYVNCNLGICTLDAATGAIKWKIPTKYGSTIPLTVVEGVVYATGDELLAIDALTGQQKWSFKAENEGNPGFLTAPYYAKGVLYAGAGDGLDWSLYGIDAKTGKKVWSTSIEPYLFNNPLVVDEILYIGDKSAGVNAYDALTGVYKFSTEQIIYKFGSGLCIVTKKGKVYYSCDSGDQQ